jgi:asparagine synthase (glutamine-hydrolysing)
MADLFFIQSARPDVIEQACAAARVRLTDLIPGGLVDRMDAPGWALLTSRNAVTPYEVSRDACGTAAVIGSTYDPRGPKVSGLRQSSPDARAQAMREYCRGLNFGMALTVQDGEVLAASDWLGLYPVYHFQSDSAFVLTSIPGLVACVRDFSPSLDIYGLVGLLLLAHTSLDHTLYKGVSRLRSGHMLRYAFDGRRRTLERVPLGAATAGPKDLDDAVEAFDGALGAMVGEAARQGARSVYLSGGLDSRIIAGYLHGAGAGPASAITLGERGDLEMRAAARVAARIGAAHERVPVDQSGYPVYAQRSLDQDGLTSGLYVLAEWVLSEGSRPPMLAGFLGDAAMGANHAEWGRESSCDIHTFHALFAKLNASGLSPGVIRELVRADDIDDVLLDVQERLRKEYLSFPGEPRWKTWWFDILHRLRFLIGRLPKIIALGSWPVLPYAHPSVIRLAAATPLEILSDRKVQIELVRRKFPRLAVLPLARDIDRRWYTLADGRASVWARAGERLKDSLSWRAQRWFDLPERRLFVRTFDFDGAGWGVLRDRARESAGRVDSLFNREILLQLIPPSSVSTRFERLISDATGRKALVGAVLFCRQLMEDHRCG